MTEADRGEDATLFPRTVGERLRAARETLGLSLAEVAARTRVPIRHLEAIETGNFAGLPSVTYAVGFVRSYARAVGADEVALARDTRDEVANTVRTKPHYEPYEIADPARVPSRGVAIVAAGLGLAVLVLGILWFATGIFNRGGTATDAAPPVVATVPAAVTPAPAPVLASDGQVTLTANDDIWVRVYDAANKTLYLGTMKPGEKFDVPPGADNPMINIGRPDKLTITVNGSAVAPLGTGDHAIKDVPISAAALSARQAGAPVPAPTPSASTPAAFSSTAPAATERSSRPAQTRSPRPRATPTPRPRASPSDGPENLLPSDFATPKA